MYDTVYLNYTITENPSTISERVFLNTNNIKVTESVSELHNGHKLDRWTRGELDNLKVTMTSNTVSVKGSICKYHFGNNLYTLSMKDTKEVINSISESLGLNMNKASVSRVDWSTNLSTTHPPTLYMPKLGDLSRFNRLENPNSIYYNQSAKRLLFYDKMIEAKKKKVEIPEEFIGKNLLRYEMVLNSKVNKHLNSDVNGNSLYREEIYKKMADLWYSYYKDINKISDRGIKIKMEQIKTERDFERALLTGLAQKLGIEEINHLIKQMKSKGVFKHNEYYSRLRSKFKKLCKEDIDENDIISEINKKIDEVYFNL